MGFFSHRYSGSAEMVTNRCYLNTRIFTFNSQIKTSSNSGKGELWGELKLCDKLLGPRNTELVYKYE